jgi:hypothetical protein
MSANNVLPERANESPVPPAGAERNVYVTLTLIIQVIVGAGLAVLVYRRDWENVFLAGLVMGLTLIPTLLGRRYRIFVPPEFQLTAAAFVFLSVFMGSIAGLYERFWWWDVFLHTSSGFLLGIVGFVALFLLNRTNRMPQGMRPGFLCFFAVIFAMALGVVWEVFEFAVDIVRPEANMQRRETGVVDTMQDLIVDTLGAVVVAAMAWAYLRTGRYSFVADGVRSFVQKNPRLFGGATSGDN